jgi:hypothetical protein
MVTTFVLAQGCTSQVWTLGLLGAGALAFFVIARLSPPGWIENWEFGAWGEQATAKELRPLESGADASASPREQQDQDVGDTGHGVVGRVPAAHGR